MKKVTVSLAECGGRTLSWAMEWLSSGSQKSQKIEDIHESSLMGPSWGFCVFVLYNSHHSVISDVLDIRTSPERHPASPVVRQDDQTASVFITNSLSSPLFPVTWEAKLEHVHWDIGQEKGNWLVDWRHQSWGNAPSPFDRKKWLTVSVCSVGRYGHPEVGEWRVPEWRKTCQNGDNK